MEAGAKAPSGGIGSCMHPPPHIHMGRGSQWGWLGLSALKITDRQKVLDF